MAAMDVGADVGTDVAAEASAVAGAASSLALLLSLLLPLSIQFVDVGVATGKPRPKSSVCVENLVRIDLMGESLNVGRDGRAALFLSDAVGLAVQVEEPT